MEINIMMKGEPEELREALTRTAGTLATSPFDIVASARPRPSSSVTVLLDPTQQRGLQEIYPTPQCTSRGPSLDGTDAKPKMRPQPFSAFSLPQPPQALQLLRGRSTQPGIADGHANSSSATGTPQSTSKPSMSDADQLRGLVLVTSYLNVNRNAASRRVDPDKDFPASVGTCGNLEQRAALIEDHRENGNGDHHSEKLFLPPPHLQLNVTIHAKMKADHDSYFRTGGPNPQHRDRQEEVRGILPWSQYLINWDDIEIPNFPVHNSMKQHIQALSASAEMHINDSALFEYDPSTDSGTASDAAAVRRYYLLTSNSLVTREAPLVSRSDTLMIWAHATDVGNLFGILRQRDVRPMEHLEVPGCNIFYAFGHGLYGHEWDNHNVASPLQLG